LYCGMATSSVQQTPQDRILSLASGFWVSQLIRALAKHCVIDPIVTEAKTPKQVAALCDINEEQCVRALRAAEGLGLVSTVEENKFKATESGKLLAKDHPSSLRNVILLETSDVHTRLWQNYDYTLKTGLPACKATFPEFSTNNYYHVFSSVNGHLKIFENAMKVYAQVEWNNFEKSTVDFSQHKTIVDVGAGDGFLLEQILRKYPKLRGIFFEQPPVCEAHKQSRDLVDRYTLIGGDFFKSVPRGDAYILKHILHDWNDDFCLKILNSVKAAASAGNKITVYIAEMIIKSTPGEQFAKMYDIHMAVAAGGRERTEEELKDLLMKSGFKMEKIHPTQSDMRIIEATLCSQ